MHTDRRVAVPGDAHHHHASRGLTAVAADGATSSLLATKPWGDAITLPWLRDNVLPAMPATTLQAIMNDFFDGRKADVAIKLSQQNLSQ